MIQSVYTKMNQLLYDIFHSNDSIDINNGKIAIISEHAREYPECKVFIETGTYFGSTTLALKDIFYTLYTIELDKWLFNKARVRLEIYDNIMCFCGDSSVLLPQILAQVKRPVLYWLDAHYSQGLTKRGSEDTPIIKELKAIRLHPFVTDSVILIDDARLFGSDPNYPTIEQIKEIFPDMEVIEDEDIIRIL
jgi:hypothetical protein